MGRPIKKSFFANLSSPYQDQATGGPTGEGGEPVVSVTINSAGSYSGTLPTVAFDSPAEFLGTTATGVVHGLALSASTTANGSGYNFGDTLAILGGTFVTSSTFTVAATIVVSAVKSAGGSGYNDGDLLTFSTGFSPSLILRVNRPGGGTGTPDNFTITQAGRRTSANPTNPVTYDSRTGSGNGCTVDLTFGVYSISSPVIAGDYTAVPANPVYFVDKTNSGTGAQANITYGVKSVAVSNGGSHYINVADAAITFSSGSASATPVLGTSNAANTGLLVYTNIIDGTAGAVADIMKQESSHRYLVKTRADNGLVGQCMLVAKDPGYLLPGEMCLIASDTTGSTYYVTKLTAHRATLARQTSVGGGWRFATGDVAGWTIGNAATGVVSLSTTA